MELQKKKKIDNKEELRKQLEKCRIDRCNGKG
jgi:hypothetical protein